MSPVEPRFVVRTRNGAIRDIADVAVSQLWLIRQRLAGDSFHVRAEPMARHWRVTICRIGEDGRDTIVWQEMYRRMDANADAAA